MLSQQGARRSSARGSRSHATGTSAIDTHGRLWLILFAVAFFGAFLVLVAASPLESAVRSPMPRAIARAWTDSVLPFVRPFPSVGSTDSLLADCLSLAVFGAMLLGASGALRRANARQRAMREDSTATPPAVTPDAGTERTRAVA